MKNEPMGLVLCFLKASRPSIFRCFGSHELLDFFISQSVARTFRYIIIIPGASCFAGRAPGYFNYRMIMIKAVIFDLDGTLIDSNDAHAHSWVEAFEEHGVFISFQEARELIGMGSDKILPLVTGLKKDDPEAREINRRHKEIFDEKYRARLKPFPAVKDLLTRMHYDGVKLAMASSSKKDDLETLLEIAGVKSLLDEITSSEDVEASKPDPDIMEIALRKIGHARDEVIMIGDTPYDVEAARKAGIRIVALRCGGWSDSALKGATQIRENPRDILEHYPEVLER